MIAQHGELSPSWKGCATVWRLGHGWVMLWGGEALLGYGWVMFWVGERVGDALPTEPLLVPQPARSSPSGAPHHLGLENQCRSDWEGDSVSCHSSWCDEASGAILAWADVGPKHAGSAGWLTVHSPASCQGKPLCCARRWSSPKKFLALETSWREAGQVTALN